MKRDWKTLCGAVALVLLLMLPVVSAAQAVQVLQLNTNEQKAVFFVNAAIPSDSVACKVSNHSAQVLRTGSILDGEAIVKTTILIDISTSIPNNMRDSVISAIDTLIEQKSPSEEYRLVTFGQEETTLCVFTADRYDLGKATQNIVFDGQKSMIYDAIYNTIPDSDLVSDMPTLCRTIVITDGVDLANTGITMEELFLKLQSERYPVDVLAVSATQEETPNRELSAITRISGGRYCALDPNTDLSSLEQVLGISSCSYLEVQVPEHLLDGSVRQVDLTIGTDTLSLDVKFPAIYEQPESGSSTLTPVPDSSLVPEQTNAPVSEPSFMEQYGLICAAVAAVAAVALIAVLVLVLKGRKEKKLEPEPRIAPAPRRNNDDQKTLPFSGDVQYTIKVSAPQHPGTEWVLEIADAVLIGRADHCDIKLEEKTVSREHCKIVVQEEGLEAVHLGSNHTLINGVKVTDRCPLKSGDTLRVGREQLRIDYIQKLDAPTDTGVKQKDRSSRRTESIF